MQALIERIKEVGVYLGDGIVKVDEIINHQVDATLMAQIGEEFVCRFVDANVGRVTKVVTAEVSGICPAFCVAKVLDVPMVYARKQRPITMHDGCYLAKAPSRTKPGIVKLIVSREYLGPYDRVLVVDDWLASGRTVEALATIVKYQARARLLGIGCVIEKRYEDGRERLAYLNVPIVSLALIDLDGDRLVVKEGRSK